jgi:uncharacterized lipoprotein YbaY
LRLRVTPASADFDQNIPPLGSRHAKSPDRAAAVAGQVVLAATTEHSGAVTAAARNATPPKSRQSRLAVLSVADAELQLITGHARRETLAVYQHVAVDGQLADKYQAAMKDVGL